MTPAPKSRLRLRRKSKVVLPAPFRRGRCWPSGGHRGLIPSRMSLPISVIIPTRNCRESLQRHLDVTEHWLGHVAQVIAVDSESTDGTVELLRSRLSGIGALILSRPPGLYESWNTAVAAATAPWTYFSTVGDTIAFDGLAQLHSVAEQLDADVVVSAPCMREHDGETPSDVRWPIHYVRDALGTHAAPRLLSKLETVISLCSYGSGTLLGSSAANLYRTVLLKERPFPVNFGHAGDTAWALQNCARLRLAILPQVVSDFCLGWQFEEWDPRIQRDLFLRLNREAVQALETAGDDPELRFALGWLRALAANQAPLWNWLADQADLAQDHADLRHYLQQVEVERARTLRARVKRLLGR